MGYDDNGNLTDDGVRVFTYDLENRLRTLRPAANTSGPSLNLDYDPLGRLSKTTAAPGAAGEVTTVFLYDGQNLVAEYSGATALPLRRYIHGPGVDEPLVWYEGATKHWLHADRQGSIVADTTADAVSTYTYGPYGEPSEWGGRRFRYTGQIALHEAQLYHYKARVYDPGLGRFLQTDPVGYDDDANLYAYVKNDPINNSDPSGEIAETLWDVANIVAGAASAVGNISNGNYGAAAVDAVGVVVDVAAAAVPVVPGGASTAIQAVRAGDKAADAARAAVKISPQKQASHVSGTPGNANRIKQGKATSSFFGPKSGEKLTRDTAATGRPVRGRPGVKEKDYGVSVGTGPNGGSQTRVRTHEDKDGRVHGHPSGPERFK